MSVLIHVEKSKPKRAGYRLGSRILEICLQIAAIPFHSQMARIASCSWTILVVLYPLSIHSCLLDILLAESPESWVTFWQAVLC